jgi:16S rRNA (guanine527-N7)-methyltransferase
MISGDSNLWPGFDVSRETLDLLRAYTDLVLKWTEHINLVSPVSATNLWERHIIDSAQLIAIAGPSWHHWVDLGSGAGLPGIVIAVLTKSNSTKRVTLVESDQRKAAFLRTACRELGLGSTVMTQRIEAAAPLHADVVSARALGSLPTLLAFADRHLAKSGIAIFPKGRRAQVEIEEARGHWNFDVTALQSVTDPDARILRVERIGRA